MALRPKAENSRPHPRPNSPATVSQLSSQAASAHAGIRPAAADAPAKTAACASASKTPTRHLAHHSRPRQPGSASRNGSVPVSRSPASNRPPQTTP